MLDLENGGEVFQPGGIYAGRNSLLIVITIRQIGLRCTFQLRSLKRCFRMEMDPSLTPSFWKKNKLETEV